MKILLTSISILLLAVSTASPAIAGEFAISPMVIDIDAKPGSKQEFSFNVHGKKTGNVRVYFSHMEQQSTGHMDFKDMNAIDAEFVSWIKLDKDSFFVPQGETITVTGEIEIPRKTNGSRLLAIMVEEEKPVNTKGISINVRYAVILNLDIQGKKTRAYGAFTDLKIEEQNDRHYVSGWFQNTSSVDEILSSEIYIRDASRRLVEKVILKTKSAWQRGDFASLVYPDGKVKVYGLIDKEIENGTYSLMARNRFGGRVLPSIRQEAIVSGIEKIQEEVAQNDREVRVVPNPVLVSMKSSGGGFSMVRIINPLDEEIVITFPDNHPQLHDSFRFSPSELTIAAGATGIATLRQSAFDALPAKVTFDARIKGDTALQQLIRINAVY